jgi:repressor LexA
MTERQEEILEFIRQYQQEHHLPPSTRTIQRHFGFSSQNSVMSHLRALSNKQQLAKLDDRKWGLKAHEVQGQLFSLPVYGSIPAGLPAMQEQSAEEVLTVDPAVFGLRQPKPHQYWALRVKGDSMIDAHILEDDLVVLERREAREGDIVAALVDETTTTLKRLVRAGGRLILRAENKRYRDIIPDRLETQGVLVGVIRRHRASA